MKLMLGENIRKMRKERGLTQEQLAEAFGVTVGAVSKWESAQSNPDLALLPMLAEFFETSVDVLLGYEWQSGGMGAAVERLKTLRSEKRYDEGAAAVSMAVQKYPNSFDIIYNSASLMEVMGIERHDNAALRRSMELYERSLGLLAQNTDERISEITINLNIAVIYSSLGETDKALEILKRYNVQGMNNDQIGYLLAVECRRPDEALPYISEALIDILTLLIRTSIAFINAMGEKGQHREALEFLQWARGVISPLLNENRISFLDKSCVMLLAACAHIYMELGEEDNAENCLREALKAAKRFDAAPDYSMEGVRFYHGGSKGTAFDSFGQTALEGIELSVEDGENEALRRIWSGIKAEEQ